ncbi:hypothetical protein ABTK43_19275, partial [Acinetobacter baumannii]
APATEEPTPHDFHLDLALDGPVETVEMVEMVAMVEMVEALEAPQRHDAEPVAELPAPGTEAQPEEAAAAAPLLTLIEPSAVAPEPPASDPE